MIEKLNQVEGFYEMFLKINEIIDFINGKIWEPMDKQVCENFEEINKLYKKSQETGSGGLKNPLSRAEPRPNILFTNEFYEIKREVRNQTLDEVLKLIDIESEKKYPMSWNELIKRTKEMREEKN